MFNPNRLTFARKRRGLTKIKLAQAIGVEPRTVTAYEAAEHPPSEETLQKLALFLRFPLNFFLGDDLELPSPEGVSFRSLSKMTASQRDAASSSATIAFLLNKWIEKRFSLPKVNLLHIDDAPPEEAAIMLRQHWGIGNLPIQNMTHLLEAHGVRVFLLDEKNAEVDAFSLWKDNIPFIFLNTQKSTERSRFDAAHELGHLVLHRHGLHKGIDVEKEANEFASAFLMPKDSILALSTNLLTVRDLVQLKKKWIVSVAALAYRLHKLGRMSDWHYRTLCIDMAGRGYRTQEPDEAERELSKVLSMVLQALWVEGITLHHIAKDLDLYPEEIKNLISKLASNNTPNIHTSNPSNKKPNLRLVK